MADEKRSKAEGGARATSHRAEAPRTPAGRSRVDERVARRTLYSAAAEVEERDVAELVERASEIDRKLESVPGRLRRTVRQVRLLFELIGDFWRGDYRKVPWLAITMAAAAVIYFLNPFDLIPDMIPIIGYLDDAMVVGLAVLALEDDLKAYCEWKGYELDHYFGPKKHTES
jgi:uncharacterized membrane protein YkvA (DUF1232 family)